MKTIKSDQTRQFIIEKSAPIFNKKGYLGTSLSDLTSATGLTKGSIYGNFANKDEVALASLKYSTRQINEAITKAIVQEYTSINKLRAYTKYYRSNYERLFQQGGCPLLNAAADTDDVQPKMTAVVTKMLNHWTASIKQLILRGIRRGEIKPGTDMDHTATILVALVQGGIMLAKTTGNHAHLHRSLNQFDAIIEQMKLK